MIADSARWPITDADRIAVVNALMKLVESDDTPVAIRACRVLIQMEKQNQQWEAGQSELIHARLARLMRERN